MIGWVSMLAACSLLAANPDDALTFSATIDAEKFRLGGKYEIVITVNAGQGVSTADAGIPHPILQINVPECATLIGRELKTQKELAGNEYLQSPFELLLTQESTRVAFKLKGKAGPDDRFSFNLIAYVSADGGSSVAFVRKRFDLSLAPGAQSIEVAEKESGWGRQDVLQIGDKAPDFSLPGSDGTTIALSQYLGQKSVIVTTYRAFW